MDKNIATHEVSRRVADAVFVIHRAVLALEDVCELFAYVALPSE